MIRISIGWIGLLGALYLNPASAADPAKEIAAAGSLLAQAIRYEHGEGVARNSAKAAELYCAGARTGDADAAYNLGWMYANGRGLERDDGIAVALFRRAAGQGHLYASRMLQKIPADNVRLPDCIPGPELAVVVPVKFLRPPEAPVAAASAIAPIPEAEQREVSEAVAAWLAAWSRKDVDAYLAAYTQDFAARRGLSPQQWERERRARIIGKSWIAVTIDSAEISVDGDIARTRFRQDYRSDKVTENNGKTLTLVKVDRKWLIQQERSAN